MLVEAPATCSIPTSTVAGEIMGMQLHAHQHFIQRSSKRSALLRIVMHMMILPVYLHAVGVQQIMSSHIVLAGKKKVFFSHYSDGMYHILISVKKTCPSKTARSLTNRSGSNRLSCLFKLIGKMYYLNHMLTDVTNLDFRMQPVCTYHNDKLICSIGSDLKPLMGIWTVMILLTALISLRMLF